MKGTFVRVIAVLFASLGVLSLRSVLVPRTHNPQLKAASREDITSNIETLCHLCPTLQIIDSNNEIYRIASDLEKVGSHVKPNMEQSAERNKLNGLWRTLATSLKMTKLVSFSQLLMTKVDKQLDERSVEIEDLLQYIDFDKEVYDNYVAVKVSNANKDNHMAVVTRGAANYAESEGGSKNDTYRNRLAVSFTVNELVPFSPLKLTESGFVKQRQAECNTDALRKFLNLNKDAALHFPLNIKGWSDCTFLSDDGNIRIMRGNNQNIYILKRVA